MIATGVIVVKGWQLYGPSNEQVKTLAFSALEKAQAAWSGSPKTANDSPPIADPRLASPPVAAAAASIIPAPMDLAPQLVPLDVAKSGENAGDLAPSTMAPPAATTEQQHVAELIAQLQQLGAPDAQVVQWGSSGRLFRCSCKAKLAEASPLARHFEAVANAPTEALEQVVAKVEAWRTQQQGLLR
jgi:hypothetical protein